MVWCVLSFAIHIHIIGKFKHGALQRHISTHGKRFWKLLIHFFQRKWKCMCSRNFCTDNLRCFFWCHSCPMIPIHNSFTVIFITQQISSGCCYFFYIISSCMQRHYISISICICSQYVDPILICQGIFLWRINSIFCAFQRIADIIFYKFCIFRYFLQFQTSGCRIGKLHFNCMCIQIESLFPRFWIQFISVRSLHFYHFPGICCLRFQLFYCYFYFSDHFIFCTLVSSSPASKIKHFFCTGEIICI